MHALFTELNGSDTKPARRRELTAFLKELCTMSGSLQQTGPSSKEAFYKVCGVGNLFDETLKVKVGKKIRSNR